MTQAERIKTHLVQYGAITAHEANDLYGITRLSARVWELRRDGMNIKSRDISVQNRYGDTIRVSQYFTGG